MSWTAYALIEAGFCTLRPLIAGDQQIVNSTNWKFTAILFGAYIAAGILSGAVVGLVAPKLGRQRQTGERAVPPYQQLTALTVAIGYLATALTEPSQSVAIRRLALAIGLVIVAGIGAELLWPVLRQRTSLFSDPWMTAVLLAGGPWLLSSLKIRHLAEIGIVAAAAFAVSAKVLNRGPGIDGFRIRHALAAGTSILMIPAIALVASENAGPLPARQTTGTDSLHRPNIVLVVLDTVRADHLSLSGYGRRTTPWLEEFARESTVFARATAASNFTLPTHATMFTGLYPRSHGATIFPPGKSLGQPLDGKFETLAEALSERGYLNYGITANYGYLGREFGLNTTT